MKIHNLLKKWFVIASCFLFFSTISFAQVRQDPEEIDTHHKLCGAIPSPTSISAMDSVQPLVLEHTHRFLSTKSGSRQMHPVPLKAHIIRQTNGSGGLTITQWNNALSILNTFYQGANLQFVECSAPNIINNSQYYNMTNSLESQLHNAHGIPNVLNVYIPGGTLTANGDNVCGYASFPGQNQPDLTIITSSCMTNDNTFAHEVGHYLGLYHSHGTENCPPPITDELVNGSNCNTHGDRVCDTPADPGLSGLNCSNLLVNSNCIYTGNLVDANGHFFVPNPRNIMSYSRKECRDFFSQGQLARANYFAINNRGYLDCPSINNGAALTMITNITATPNPVNQDGQMQFSFNVRNTSTSSFTGVISLDLVSLSNVYIEELGISNQFTLTPNQSFSPALTTPNYTINQLPGTYKVIAYQQQTGSDWLQINDDNFNNFSNEVQITVSTATCSAPTTSEFNHSNVSTTAAQLSTTAGGNQFQFRHKLSSGSTWTTSSESASTSTNINSLAAGTSYDYQVRRRCTNNVWSNWSATKMFNTTTATCPTPTGLAAAATGYSHVLLNWNTVIGGSGYQTRLRTGSQNWNEGQVYSFASSIWYNMIPFTQYEFQVRAQCSSGNFSAWSTSVFITTQGQDDPYCYSYGISLNDWIAGVAVGTIDNFSSNGYGYTNFTSQTANLQPNSPYYIQLTPGTNDSPETVYWRVWIDLNGDNDFIDNGEQVFQASGLTSLSVAGNITIPVSASPGLTRMRISMSAGDYPSPCETGILLDVEDYSVNIISTCSAPTISEFNHSNVANTAAQLSTTAVGNLFQFRHKLSSGSTWTTSSESANTSTSIGSLAAGTSYDYQVRRRCTNNVWSNWSATKMFNTTTATCPTPTGLTISNIGATSFTVSWNTVSGATAYEIQVKHGPTGDWYNIGGNPFGESPVNVTGAPDNTVMQCRVRSICGSNNSSYTNEVSFMTAALPCSVPTTAEFNHSNVTMTTAQLSTTAIGNLFQFRHKLSSGSTWTTTSESASTSTSIGSLTAGTSYDYQIRRRCSNNVWSDWSATKMFNTTIATCPTPTGLTISNIGATSFTVSWNAVSGATAYEIQLKQGPTGDWYNIEGNPFGGSPVNVPGVPDNMAMQCRVRSICGSNNSPYTNEVSFMTAALPCSVPTTSEFNHSNVTTTTAQLNTTASGNQFQFRHKPSSGSTWTTTLESASTNTSIGSLTAGTSYDYQIRQRCSNNVWSDWSPSKSFLTEPIIVSLNVSPSSIAPPAIGGSATITVTGNCNTWTVGDTPFWINVTPTSGSNSGTILVNFQSNETTESRMAILTINGCGQTYTVTLNQASSIISFPWTTSITGSNHSIIIPNNLQMDIDGQPLQIGDLIGLFFERNGILHCSNFVVWNGAQTAIAAYGNDAEGNDIKNGFATGEAFKVKVYRKTTGQELSAQASYAPIGSPSFVTHTSQYGDNGISFMQSLSASSSETLNIELSTGWNLISSYIMPSQADMNVVLNPIAEQVVILKNHVGQVVFPSENINVVGDWKIREGYQVKTTTPVVLQITGTKVDPASTQIPIVKGWQTIAYLRDKPGNTVTHLASITNNIELVKNNVGQIYFPSLNINNLTQLLPTQGYKIKALGTDTLIYPSSFVPEVEVQKNQMTEQIVNQHFILDDGINTGNNSTLIFLVTAVSNLMEFGDEIGVFNTKGSLCGAGVYDGKNFAVTVWGDDPTTGDELEGMVSGEEYIFRIWSATSLNERSVKATFSTGIRLFQEDALAVVSLIELISSTSEVEISFKRKLNLIPNPNDGRFNLQVDMKSPFNGNLRIINTLGQSILTEKITLTEGVNTIPIHISTPVRGHFILMLQSGIDIQYARFEVH